MDKLGSEKSAYRVQIANIHWIIEKAREFQKKSTSLLTPLKISLCGSQQTMENASKDGNIRPAYWLLRNLQVKKQQLELDIEQRTGIKLGKGYIKAVYCQHACFTHMQSMVRLVQSLSRV